MKNRLFKLSIKGDFSSVSSQLPRKETNAEFFTPIAWCSIVEPFSEQLRKRIFEVVKIGSRSLIVKGVRREDIEISKSGNKFMESISKW